MASYLFSTPANNFDEYIAEVAVSSITQHDSAMTVTQLTRIINSDPDLQSAPLTAQTLYRILQKFPNNFKFKRTRYEDFEVYFEFDSTICENVRRCQGSPFCDLLHICKFYLSNDCRKSDNSCAFGHNLKSQKNFTFLKRNHMITLDPHTIKDLLLNKYTEHKPRPVVICNFYNTLNGCREGHSCPFLHICRHYSEGTCKFGTGCKRNHNVLSSDNRERLERNGIITDDPREILRMIRGQTMGSQWAVSVPNLAGIRSGHNGIYMAVSVPNLAGIRPEMPAMYTNQRIQRLPSRSYSYDMDEDMSDLQISDDEEDMVNRNTPGKPFSAQTNSDSILLSWRAVANLSPINEYQVQFKDVSVGKWKIYPDTAPHNASRLRINGLKARSGYVFRVRVLDSEKGIEKKFSEESNTIHTLESPAKEILRKSKMIICGNPNVYKLPLNEVLHARNNTAKTRKFTLGTGLFDVQERTMMLVGATGSGKSTLINGLANYLIGVNWDDGFRFTLVDMEKEEERKHKDQAISQTEWITCYSIHSDVTSKTNYTLHIVDTPGFGDTRGIQRDEEIIEQIRQMFLLPGDKGIACIDAVCFLVKAPDARLNASQKYILDSILSLFGKDIKENICTFITFADAQEPAVLASLKKSSLPHNTYFKFNNSALFENNSTENPTGISSAFWEIGTKSFESFFSTLEQMETKSLTLTNEVLKTRQDMENTVHNLQREIEAGISKITVLEEEIRIFTINEKAIKENRDFTYEVTEQVQEKEDLSGKGQHTTNCLTCNYTCHEKCHIAKDEDKARCSAMNADGTCKQCPESCFWRAHHNTPYIIRWVSKRVTKTYSEKLRNYASAKEKIVSQTEVIQNMNRDIKRLENGIATLLQIVTNCNNKLKQIALSQNPMSTVEYIDLIIASEKRERKHGYQMRLEVLEKCKKKAMVGDEASVFLDRAKKTRSLAINRSDISLSYTGSSVIGEMRRILRF